MSLILLAAGLAFLLFGVLADQYICASQRVQKEREEDERFAEPIGPNATKLQDDLAVRKAKVQWDKNHVQRFNSCQEVTLLLQGSEQFYQVRCTFDGERLCMLSYNEGYPKRMFFAGDGRQWVNPGGKGSGKGTGQKESRCSDLNPQLIKTGPASASAPSAPKKEKIKPGTKTIVRNGKLYVAPDYEEIAGRWIDANLGKIDALIFYGNTFISVNNSVLSLPPEKEVWDSIGKQLTADGVIAGYRISKNGIRLTLNS